MTVMPVSSWKGMKYASRWASWNAPPQDWTRTSPLPFRFSGISSNSGSGRNLDRGRLRVGVQRNTGLEEQAGGGCAGGQLDATPHQFAAAHVLQVTHHLALEGAVGGLHFGDRIPGFTHGDLQTVMGP